MRNDNSNTTSPITDMPPSINNSTKSKNNSNNDASSSSNSSSKKSSSVPLASSVPPIFPLNTSNTSANSTLAPNLSKLGSNLNNKIPLPINPSVNLKSTVPPTSLPLPANLQLNSSLSNLNNIPALSQLLLNMNPMDMSTLLPFGTMPTLNKQPNILPNAAALANMQALMASINPALVLSNPFNNLNTPTTTQPKIVPNLKKKTPIKPNLSSSSSASNAKAKTTNSSQDNSSPTSTSPTSNTVSSDKKKVNISSTSSTPSSKQTTPKVLSPKLNTSSISTPASTSTTSSTKAKATNATTTSTPSTSASLPFLNPKLNINEKLSLPLPTPNLPLNPFLAANPLLFPALAQNPLLFGSLAAGANSSNLLNKVPAKNQFPLNPRPPIIPTTSSGGSSSTPLYPRHIAPQSKKQIHIAPAVNPLNQRQSIFNSILASAAGLQALQATAGVPITSATSLSKTPTISNPLNLAHLNPLLNPKVALSTTAANTTTSTASTTSPATTSSSVTSSSASNKNKKTPNLFGLTSMETKPILTTTTTTTTTATATASTTTTANIPNTTATKTSTSKLISNLTSALNATKNNNNEKNSNSNANKINVNTTVTKPETEKVSPTTELAKALSKLEDVFKHNLNHSTSTSSTKPSTPAISTSIPISTSTVTSAKNSTSLNKNTLNTSHPSNAKTNATPIISKTTNNINSNKTALDPKTINLSQTDLKLKELSETLAKEFSNMNNNNNNNNNTNNNNSKINVSSSNNNISITTSKNSKLENNTKSDDVLKPIIAPISNMNNINIGDKYEQIKMELDKPVTNINPLTKIELEKAVASTNPLTKMELEKAITSINPLTKMELDKAVASINPLTNSIKDFVGLDVDTKMDNSEELLSLDLDVKEDKKVDESKNIDFNNKLLEDAIKNALNNSILNETIPSVNVNDNSQLLNLDLDQTSTSIDANFLAALTSTAIATPIITTATTTLDPSNLMTTINNEIPKSTLESLATSFNLNDPSLKLDTLQIPKLDNINENKKENENIELGTKRKLNEIEGVNKLTRSYSENQEVSMDEVFDSEQFSSEDDPSLSEANQPPIQKKKKMMRWEKASFSPFQHSRRDRMSKLKNAVRSLSTGSINTTLLAADPTTQNQFSIDTKSPINNPMETTSPTSMEGFTNDYLNLNDINSMNGMNMNNKQNK